MVLNKNQCQYQCQDKRTLNEQYPIQRTQTHKTIHLASPRNTKDPKSVSVSFDA